MQLGYRMIPMWTLTWIGVASLYSMTNGVSWIAQPVETPLFALVLLILLPTRQIIDIAYEVTPYVHKINEKN